LDEVIRVNDLRKVYMIGGEKVVALDCINMNVPKGQICCILGTSGSGKSTLLNMLAGLERPSRGKIMLGTHDIAKMDERDLAFFRQKHIGFVFQSYNLINGFDAVYNVAMPLMFRGEDKKIREKKARDMLIGVGLEKRMNHLPSQMSGGQQQRVGIARAFVAGPEIIFADEPTGNLDSKTTKEVMELMVRLTHQTGGTLVLVTHDPNIAAYSDRIIRISDGNIISDELNNKETE
jgi:putative ABC transport system ATP-binding protein